MMKTRTALSLLLLTAITQISVAATSISLGPNNVLTVADAQGAQVASLDGGSISEKVSADSQTFKLSFGQDLQGRHTIIIYPDPQSPQSLNLVIMGQPVQMSQDSVLTVTANDGGTSSQFQAGVLGSVTLAGTPISPGSSLSIENGQMIATTPAALLDDDSVHYSMDSTWGTDSTASAYNESIAAFRGGLVVKQVIGTAMVAPAGTDVMNILRDSSNVPKLKEGDIIPAGATIRTDFGGEVVVAQSPGVTFQVLPNSNLEIKENSFTVENGVEKRTFDAKLNKGGIISNLDGVDRKNTDYSIKTPLAVAAARGTAFAVYTSSGISVIITSDGNVQVIGSDGKTYSVSAGEKAIVTFNPGAGNAGESRTAEFDATSSEMQAIQNLIDVARRLNQASSPSDGGSGAGSPQDQQDLAIQLEEAINTFQQQLDPTLNPGAITPTTSPNS